jgi:hypothetical protein
MKWIVIAALVMFSFGASAQNVGEAFDFIKSSYRSIPLQSNLPFYDTTVKVIGRSEAQLTEDMLRFFEGTFESYTYDTANNTFVGYGTYNFRTTKKESFENSYLVNYGVRVVVTSKGYKLAMQNFTIINQEREIDFRESYKSAHRNNGVCNQFLAYFNWHNQKQIRKIGRDINSLIMPSSLTASR